VDLVLAGKLSIGALVAVMMLTWRSLSPLQVAFMSVARLQQVRSSIRQIDALMNLRPEREAVAHPAPMPSLLGKVGFLRASLRYGPDADPALMGVSFEARPGELVCITGWNGSGKSSILKLIMGLYPLQSGSVRIDDVDIRQLDPIEIRHAIGYVPQTCHFFYGTIAQNLRLTRPLASEAELVEACIDAGVWHQIEELPEGLATRLGDFRMEAMAASFLQKIALARALLKRSRILLLDEPVNGLDFQGDQAFMDLLTRLRGTTTIFLVTHRPSHLRMADRVLVLESGMLRLIGPPDEVLRNLPEGCL
jgi:ATP-binding cassette subfamily C protein/ATP-binding cassette subfamily C protein LapB